MDAKTALIEIERILNESYATDSWKVAAIDSVLDMVGEV